MPHQASDEMISVQNIFTAFERVGARRQIQRRTHRSDSAQLARRGLAEFACHFQHQVSAHGISGKENFRDCIALREFGEDRAVVAAQPGIIECRSEPLRSAAVSLVQPDHAKSLAERFFRGSPHVARFAGPFQAVYQDQRGMFPRLGLPVTVAEQLRPWLGFEEPLLRRRKRGESPRDKTRGERHQVIVAKKRMRLERNHSASSLAHVPVRREFPAHGDCRSDAPYENWLRKTALMCSSRFDSSADSLWSPSSLAMCIASKKASFASL